jgi:hypothetical protein
MTEGKKVRVQIKTMRNVYEGDMLIPPMRRRVADVVNDEQRLFINLTDVTINNHEHAPFVSVNKNLITAILQLDSPSSEKAAPRAWR